MEITTTGGKTAYVVVVSRVAYVDIKEAMPAVARFTNVEEWGFNHIWFYAPTGDIIILTPTPIEKLESMKLQGSFK